MPANTHMQAYRKQNYQLMDVMVSDEEESNYYSLSASKILKEEFCLAGSHSSSWN